MRQANAQTSLHFRADSPELSLLACVKYGMRLSARPKPAHVCLYVMHLRICDKFQNLMFWSLNFILIRVALMVINLQPVSIRLLSISDNQFLIKPPHNHYLGITDKVAGGSFDLISHLLVKQVVYDFVYYLPRWLPLLQL